MYHLDLLALLRFMCLDMKLTQNILENQHKRKLKWFITNISWISTYKEYNQSCLCMWNFTAGAPSSIWKNGHVIKSACLCYCSCKQQAGEQMPMCMWERVSTVHIVLQLHFFQDLTLKLHFFWIVDQFSKNKIDRIFIRKIKLVVSCHLPMTGTVWDWLL